MRNKRCGIYKLTISRLNRPPLFYIGQSSDLEERGKQHIWDCRAGRHHNYWMQALYNKYGEAAFSCEVILICEKEQNMLNIYEQLILEFYINDCGASRVINVLRQCVASARGVKRRPETLVRMSEAQKGRKKRPEEVEKMAASLRGRVIPPDVRRKISERHKGIERHPHSLVALEMARLSPLRLERLREAKRASGYSHSQETRARISASLTGKKQTQELIDRRIAPLRGRKQTPKEIAKRVASRLANAAAKKEAPNGDGTTERPGRTAATLR